MSQTAAMRIRCRVKAVRKRARPITSHLMLLPEELCGLRIQDGHPMMVILVSIMLMTEGRILRLVLQHRGTIFRPHPAIR